ncbi:hypothetical protein, partial [Cetobacterium sp.]|uniref:hypothetical protein n=1 Tax=Cetobacterium sp. TaxID=2071632 RepID=UPI003F3C0D74
LKKLAMWKFGKDFLNTNFYKNNSKFIKIKKMAIKYYYSIAICLQPETFLSKGFFAYKYKVYIFTGRKNE